MTDVVANALGRASEAAAERPFRLGAADGRARRKRIAIGDPQAPLARVLSILSRHGLLGDDGWLAPEVQLVSLGDHFDWGSAAERAHARSDGLALLAWLAAHPADQVTLVLGNHDLGRVGELAGFDDARFARAQAEADALYDARHDTRPDQRVTDRAREDELIARHGVGAELLARDFSSFGAAQRALVTQLLQAGRFVVGFAAGDHELLCHAGVTADDLALLGLPATEHADARAVAAALQAALHAAVGAWQPRTPLAIGALHRPGDAQIGEGRGIFYQRPGNPDDRDANEPALFHGPPRRRFDPRALPRGLTQIIGHIRDKKCRDLLTGWHDGAAPVDGPLRHLSTDGTRVRYAQGLPARTTAGSDSSLATLIFTDAGMLHAPEHAYTLYDLDTRAPARRA